jgi:hypothetical protein
MLFVKGDAMPFRKEAFEPEIIAVMTAAYERACSTIVPSPNAERAKEIVAKRIIELATQGWTDADRLCSEVLKVVASERISPTTH